jgi:endonuclease-8
MSEGDGVHRAASALRTALAGKPMVRFDAACLMGPTPRAGRVVERVENHGKHIEIVWDDNMVLHTNLRLSGSWHVYRHGEPWRKPYQQMSVAIEVADRVVVCFNAAVTETYRIPDKRRHPGMGRLGPDLCHSNTDPSMVVNLLLSYADGAARLGEVLLDQRVVRGVGNVYRCEVLWATELSPFARIDALTEHDAIRVINAAATMLRANMQQAECAAMVAEKGGLAVYGRNGQRCRRCGETIDCRPLGQHGRMLYWCRGCQQHLDPHHTVTTDDTPMDPHPAAQAYLAGLPWNRDAG